jgi:hypothetical protein
MPGRIYGIGVAAFLGCVVILTVGRRIERTLELLNWILVVTILGGFFVLVLLFVPGSAWLEAVAGFGGFDLPSGTFDPLPAGADFFLIGALVAYSGSGGVVNIVLSNWARDRGYGMGERAGYIPAAAAGEKGMSHTLASCSPATSNRWNAGTGGGEWCQRINGASSGSAPSLECFCPRCSTSRSFRAAPTFKVWESALR